MSGPPAPASVPRADDDFSSYPRLESETTAFLNELTAYRAANAATLTAAPYSEFIKHALKCAEELRAWFVVAHHRRELPGEREHELCDAMAEILPHVRVPFGPELRRFKRGHHLRATPAAATSSVNRSTTALAQYLTQYKQVAAQLGTVPQTDVAFGAERRGGGDARHAAGSSTARRVDAPTTMAVAPVAAPPRADEEAASSSAKPRAPLPFPPLSLQEIRAAPMPEAWDVFNTSVDELLPVLHGFKAVFGNGSFGDAVRYGVARRRSEQTMVKVDRVLQEGGVTHEQLFVALASSLGITGQLTAVGRAAAPAASSIPAAFSIPTASSIRAAVSHAANAVAASPPSIVVDGTTTSRTPAGSAAAPAAIAASSSTKRSRRDDRGDETEDEEEGPGSVSRKNAITNDSDSLAGDGVERQKKNTLTYPSDNKLLRKVEILDDKLPPIVVTGGKFEQMRVKVDPTPVIWVMRRLLDLNSDSAQKLGIANAVVALPPEPFETVVAGTVHVRKGARGMCGLCARALFQSWDDPEEKRDGEEHMPKMFHPVLDTERVKFSPSGKVEGHGFHTTCAAVLKRVGVKRCPCPLGYGQRAHKECRKNSAEAATPVADAKELRTHSSGAVVVS